MTSHREAPKISKDPVADNTDLYAFVSPDKPDTVTILANYIPLEEPAGGPNFNAFGDDVLYEIMIDNNGDGVEDVTFQFRFKTKIGNPNSFLYNTGPIGSLADSAWNVKQFYSVTKVLGPRRSGSSSQLGNNLSTPPVNIGPRSTPNYADLANAAVNTLSDGSTVFAGQRDEAFYVDLGSIFDLGTLRPFQNLHLISTPAAPGVDTTKGFSVHTIGIQVSKNLLTHDGSNPSDPSDEDSVVGIWASASRRKATILPGDGDDDDSGQFDDDTSPGFQTGKERPVEHRAPQVRLSIPCLLSNARAPETFACALPERLSKSRRVQQTSSRPGGYTPYRNPVGDNHGLPKLHGNSPGRLSTPQHGHPAKHYQPQQAGNCRTGPCRIPQRTAGRRRRHRHRTEGNRRGHPTTSRP